jgi:catechol 2,3-dioxygenase-like lactoylglutathione lyase family enzyme
MAIQGFHHVQLTIPRGGEAEARSFYVDRLGLREIAKPDDLAARGGFWLAVGDAQLHVGLEDGVDRLATRAHPAFWVDDLDALTASLGAAGHEVHVPVALPGLRRVELRDPFGNRLELVQRA